MGIDLSVRPVRNTKKTIKDSEISYGVKLGRIEMKNPVMVASGTFGYGEEYNQLMDISKLGAIVTKSITLNPRIGNPSPRIAETPSGMLNSIGLQNVGVEKFVLEKLPFLRKTRVPVIVSIAGERTAEYVEIARRLNTEEGISGIELNISCPNVEEGGMGLGTYPHLTHMVVNKVRKVTKFTLIAKLSPNVTDIVTIAKAAEEGGCDALSLVNTFLGMAIDVKKKNPKLANITGGLSGPCIKPIALRMVWQVSRAVKLPVIGMGGIMDSADAIEFIMAGATAVAIGTGNFVNPMTAIEVIDGIKKYMVENKFSRLSEMKIK